MYMSSTLWTFKPGMSNRVHQVIKDQILPAVRRTPGVHDVYVAPAEGDTWLSVLFYESQAQAEEGVKALVPVVHQHMGDIIEGMERHAGEVTLEGHVR